MSRARALLIAIGLVGGLALFASARGSDAPIFANDQCAVRQITDTTTGAPILGAEDLALSADGTTLYVSAYDRLSVEAARKAGNTLPNGGLYRLAVSDLLAADTEAESLIDPVAIGGLRPHGIALDANRLAIVNRRGGEDGTGAVIETYDLATSPPQRTAAMTGPEFCAANDLAWQGEKLLITRDRAHCPGWSFGERVLGQRRASVIALTPEAPDPIEILADRLFFANGIAAARDGRVFIAETRGEQVQALSEGGPTHLIKAPGGPDNLSLFGDSLIAAWQPNLLRFGLYIFGRTKRVTSRISRWQAETGWTLLYKDPDGRQFPGATVGVQPREDVLIAGSVRAPGLLVCQGETGS